MQQIINGRDGVPLYAVEIVPMDGPLRSGGAETATEAAENLRAVGATIAQSCEDIFGAVRESAEAVLPDELEVAFGVTLGGEAGLPWIRATGEANFTVTARWHRGW